MGLLEGLLDFLEVLEKADVGRHLHGGGGDAGEDVQNLGVDFAAVGLAGDGDAGVKTHLLRDHGIKLIGLVEVAVEELEERSLGAGRTFGAQEF